MPGGGGFGKQAAIGRIELAVRAALMRADRGQRAVELAECRRDQRFAGEEAGIGHQIAGFEIVGAVEHEIVAADQRHHIVGIEPHGMRLEMHMRIERVNLIGGAVDLAPADIGRGVDDLALQIGQRHDVVIDHAERADAGRRQIHQHRRAEAAGADHQHGGLLQRRLAGAADVAQHDMAGVAFEFVGRQHGRVTSIVRHNYQILMVRSALAPSRTMRPDCRPSFETQASPLLRMRRLVP